MEFKWQPPDLISSRLFGMCLSNEIAQGVYCQVSVIGNKLGSFVEVINAFIYSATHSIIGDIYMLFILSFDCESIRVITGYSNVHYQAIQC